MLTKRNLFIVLGIVIAAEIIWAGWTFFKPISSVPQVAEQQAATVQPKPTTVTLTSDKTTLKVGESVTVAINLSSDKKTDGVDLIISFDPKLLSARPVILGKLYSDYPQNVADDKAGKLSVSGITSQAGGVLADGLFGSIEFRAKAPGVAAISLEFTPGKSSDSNVTESETGKDVLEKVFNLELNILP